MSDSATITAPSSSALRHVIESLVMLTASVLIFRTFGAEGYLISTGSMAPSLLGYHRQMTCPTCSHLFARGMSLDEAEGASSMASTASAHAGPAEGLTGTTCPNCGQIGLRTAHLPRNEGDQLLVNKNAFQWRTPRRWEVIVFRNPSEPLEAYVKRAVGLPGETIEIRDGEVYADQKQHPKDLTAQLGTRILVDAHLDQPVEDHPEWKARWRSERGDSSWEETSRGFQFAGSPDTAAVDWLEFRHWVVSGGSHTTSVTLERWPAGLDIPPESLSTLHFDPQSSELSVAGAWPAVERDRWMKRSEDPLFQEALEKLYNRSHLAPITDDYGYNQKYEGTATHRVHDVMLEFTLPTAPQRGQLTARMTWKRTVAACELDFARGLITVTWDGATQPAMTCPLPSHLREGPHTYRVSTFDGQWLLAADDRELCQPLPLPASTEPPAAAWVERVARIGVRGDALEVQDLRIYRDVYYTPKNDTTGKSFSLRTNELFVLGDNSPVSVDSRCWPNPGVPLDTLIGKPFIVHLPSRPGKISLAGNEQYVRVPDFSRVRFIR